MAFLSPQHTDTTCTLSALVGAYVHGGRRRATPTRLARPPRTAALTSIFEQGRLGHRNGEAPNDGAEHEVANAREPEQTRSGNGARQRGLDSFLSGTASNQEWSAGAAGRGMPASGRGRRRLASRSTTRARSSPSTNDGTPTPLRTSAGWSSCFLETVCTLGVSLYSIC